MAKPKSKPITIFPLTKTNLFQVFESRFKGVRSNLDQFEGKGG